MKNRTRVLALGAAAALATTALVGPAASAQDEADPVEIGLVTHVLGNPFIQTITEYAQIAADELGVDLKIAGPPGGSAEEQIALIQGFVDTGVDGIMASVPGTTLANPINEIVATGLPFVQFNLADPGAKGVYVGERSTQSGRLLGQAVIDLLGGNDTASGQVFIGNCFPGFPSLENRSRGVRESLATAPGIEVNATDFDVTVDPVTNLAAWEAILTANPDAVALIGLCAPDLASLGQVQAANMDLDFIAGGYDFTPDNLAALEAGLVDVSLGQTPFMQGYLPVRIIHDVATGAVDIDLSEGGFLDAGTEIAYSDSVTEPFGLPPLTFEELKEISADPAKAREYYQPLVDGVIANWAENLEPIENEGK